MKSFTLLKALALLQCMSVTAGHGIHHGDHHVSRDLKLQELAAEGSMAFSPYNTDSQAHPDLCATPQQTTQELEKQKAVLSIFQEKAGTTGDGSARKLVEGALCIGCVEIQTYFHVITNTEKTMGNLDDNTIEKQMVELNKGYRDTPFFFTLKGVTRTHDTSIFDLVQSFKYDTANMQSAIGARLQQGDRMTLNVYTLKMLPATLGLATYPSGFDGIKDGVFIDYCSVPGGSCPSYNSGKILVHEVGHWLGLLHVFQGGCDEEFGDYVSDTPAQKKALWVCDATSNSCGGSKRDPITNYMGYAMACLQEFSPGQILRMYEEFMVYRNGQRPCKENEGVLNLELKLDDNPEQNSWLLLHATGQLIALSSFGENEEHRKQHSTICAPYDSPLYFSLTDDMSDGFTDEESYFHIRFDGKLIKDDRNFGKRGVAAMTMKDGCPSGQELVAIEMLLDDFPTETSWGIIDANKNVVYQEAPYQLYDSGFYYEHASVWREICLPEGDYTLVLHDSFGDGFGSTDQEETPYYRINIGSMAEDIQYWDEGKIATYDFKVVYEEPPPSPTTAHPSSAPTLSSPAPTLSSSAPTLLPTPPPVTENTGSFSSISSRPLKDTFVRDSSSTANYGDYSSLGVAYGSIHNERITYINMDLRGVTGAAQTAELSLFVKEKTGPIDINIHPVKDNDWDENGITWDTQPEIDTETTLWSGSVSDVEEWMTFDFASHITDILAADPTAQSFSIAIVAVPVASGSERAKFESKENEDIINLPEFVITFDPTVAFNAVPSKEPTNAPTDAPTAYPSPSPTASPSIQDSEEPTMAASGVPSVSPSARPSPVPSVAPTVKESFAPSMTLSDMPSPSPSALPTGLPTLHPSATPSRSPTASPSASPSAKASPSPTGEGSNKPSLSSAPSPTPSSSPTAESLSSPTLAPSASPTAEPSSSPTAEPSASPTAEPSSSPTAEPSSSPTAEPSSSPTAEPSSNAINALPTIGPSSSPSETDLSNLLNVKGSDQTTSGCKDLLQEDHFYTIDIEVPSMTCDRVDMIGQLILDTIGDIPYYIFSYPNEPPPNALCTSTLTPNSCWGIKNSLTGTHTYKWGGGGICGVSIPDERCANNINRGRRLPVQSFFQGLKEFTEEQFDKFKPGEGLNLRDVTIQSWMTDKQKELMKSYQAEVDQLKAAYQDALDGVERNATVIREKYENDVELLEQQENADLRFWDDGLDQLKDLHKAEKDNLKDRKDSFATKEEYVLQEVKLAETQRLQIEEYEATKKDIENMFFQKKEMLDESYSVALNSLTTEKVDIQDDHLPEVQATEFEMASLFYSWESDWLGEKVKSKYVAQYEAELELDLKETLLLEDDCFQDEHPRIKVTIQNVTTYTEVLANTC